LIATFRNCTSIHPHWLWLPAGPLLSAAKLSGKIIFVRCG
jgi:hypothetical protein